MLILSLQRLFYWPSDTNIQETKANVTAGWEPTA